MSRALGQNHPYLNANGKHLNENIAQMTSTTNALDLNSSLTISRQPVPRS
ncbi:unnamed protein product, partial [Rotaria magnacalcarata]